MTPMDQALNALGKGQGAWTKDTAENVAKIIAAKEAESARLRKAIQDYLDGNWGTRLPRKTDKCPHGQFGWEDCGNCVDEYFQGVLNAGQQPVTTGGDTHNP